MIKSLALTLQTERWPLLFNQLSILYKLVTELPIVWYPACHVQLIIVTIFTSCVNCRCVEILHTICFGINSYLSSTSHHDWPTGCDKSVPHSYPHTSSVTAANKLCVWLLSCLSIVFCSATVCLDHAGLFVINMSSHDSGDGVYASHCVYIMLA